MCILVFVYDPYSTHLCWLKIVYSAQQNAALKQKHSRLNQEGLVIAKAQKRGK
jgi:hypothetical protein